MCASIGKFTIQGYQDQSSIKVECVHAHGDRFQEMGAKGREERGGGILIN